jgi:hypothetical protein
VVRLVPYTLKGNAARAPGSDPGTLMLSTGSPMMGAQGACDHDAKPDLSHRPSWLASVVELRVGKLAPNKSLERDLGSGPKLGQSD